MIIYACACSENNLQLTFEMLSFFSKKQKNVKMMLLLGWDKK